MNHPSIASACLFFIASVVTLPGQVKGVLNKIKILDDAGNTLQYTVPDSFEPIGGGGNTVDDLPNGCAFSRLARGDEGYLYEDGLSAMMTSGPEPRDISNAFKQEMSIPSANRASDWLWQWGQVREDFRDVSCITSHTI